MSWTSWIKIESENTSNVEAKQLYERTRNPATQKISDLIRITSLTPQTAELIDKLCASVYRNATGLSAREKEIAALVTSSLNGCVH
jgi:alkylhydroperoxidase family enzyme